LARLIGTILSGLLGICLGAPRFSARVTTEHRLLAFIINLTIGIFQAFTVLFCLVGWCWALGWGIILVKTSGNFFFLFWGNFLWPGALTCSLTGRSLQQVEG
jgi:Ectodermal ciliogenesis protein